MTDGPEPGWYKDPEDAHAERWWDGSTWTEHSRAVAAIASPTQPAAPLSVTVVPEKKSPLRSVGRILAALAVVGMAWLIVAMLIYAAP